MQTSRVSRRRGIARSGVRPQGPAPVNWFVEEHSEFTPTLVILGAYYDIDAIGYWDARVEAKMRFKAELARFGLPLPADPVHAELAG